jgi:FkbM family methyltransferase
MLRTLHKIYADSPRPIRRLAAQLSPVVRFLLGRKLREVRAGEAVMLVDPSDNAVFRYLRHGSAYEKTMVGCLHDLVARNGKAIFIDVGAGYGFYTFALASLTKSDKLLEAHAFEPDPRCCAAMRQSIERNGLGGVVRLKQCIVGDVDGSADLLVSNRASTSNRSFASEGPSFSANERIQIACQRLDTYFGETDFSDRNVVVKMDVEGNELRVMLGLEPILRKCRGFAMQFEFYPTAIREVGQSRQALYDLVAALQPDWLYVAGDGSLQRLDGLAGLKTEMDSCSDDTDFRGLGTAANYIVGKHLKPPQ